MGHSESATSVCSCGAPVTFYWHDCHDGNHQKAAEEALMRAVWRPGRLKNPYAQAAARSEFRDRLQLATQGELVPSDHVKRIQSQPSLDMYEIRWSGITVRERRADGIEMALDVEVRLYYVDLPDCGLAVLGCHCHEKSVEGDESQVRAAQDAEIHHAVRVFARCYPERCWEH